MIGVIACVKREERYIREWLDYHISIGVDRFYLADNNDRDYEPCLKDIVKDYANVTVIDCMGMSPVQPMCYNTIMERYGNECEWYAMIDIDEFISVKDIKAFLGQFGNADMIYLHWLNYGDNGLIHYEDKPVQERFVKPYGKHQYIKTIFRNKSVIESHIHEPFVITDQHCAMEHDYLIRKDCLGNIYIKREVGYGLPYREEEFATAYIRHYITKTLEEYMDIKANRGGACSKKEKYNLKYFFAYNEVTEEKKRLLNDKYQIVWKD